MLSFDYENQGSTTYLVYKIGENDELDTMSLGMLTNNPIPSLAEVVYTQMDTSRYIKYNVTAKVPAAQLFMGTVNRKRLLGVFNGILNAMTAADDYMLEQDTILLDLEHIFVDVTTGETEMICLPLLNNSKKNPELGQFFKSVMFNIQFDQQENCDHVTKIISFLNLNPVLVVEDFRQLLKSLEKTAAVAMPPAPRPVAPQPVVSQPAAPQPVVSQPVAPQPVAPKPVAPQPEIPKPVVQKPVVQKPVANPYVQNNVPPVQVTQPKSDEKEISWLYLMQHYNKENAALYKAQQEAKKAQKGQKAPKEQKSESKSKKKPGKQPKPGFDIPGQPATSNPGYAIPGQPVVSNPGYAVPGQNPYPVQPAQQPAAQQVSPVAPPVAPVMHAVPAQPINFGETTILGGDIGQTTVLDAAAISAQPIPYLIRLKNNEKILVNKPIFRIGKERSYVDYFIGDNTAISRSHANILNHNGDYFVTDANSTNHTYVDGVMVQGDAEVPLVHGTRLRLANEEFEFKMY